MMARNNLPPPTDDDPETQVYETSPDDATESLPISIPDSGDTGEGGKLKMIVQLVKRCLGVKDIAAMRLSLPASLLEPIPNLEYWQYLDRPDLFAAINDSPDPFERMLAALRFTFSKDLKFVRGKIVKPYNSVLGEHFRAHWSVKPVVYDDYLSEPVFRTHLVTHGSDEVMMHSAPASSSVSIKSTSSKTSKKSKKSKKNQLIVDPERTLSSLSLGSSGIDVEEEDDPNEEHVRVVYLTEQVSHHPPISSWYAEARDRGIEAAGVDQISAKVSGTTVRIQPGALNQGIFINIKSGHGAGEKYRITHPIAYVNGVLRGTFYATVAESSVITCIGEPGKEQLRAVIEYKEESWIGKAQFLVEGVIHRYTPVETSEDEDPPEYESWTKVKQVPASEIVATFQGCWRKRITWKKVGDDDDEERTLIDLSPLGVIPKTVRPISEMVPTESRRLWEGVTSNLLDKSYGEATKIKQKIEQDQRDAAADRKKRGVEFIPVYFEPDISSGKPTLTQAGREAVEAEYNLKP